MKNFRVRSRSRLEPPFFAWCRSHFFCLEPESVPGPRTSEAIAAQKSGGSATLQLKVFWNILHFKEVNIFVKNVYIVYRYRYSLKTKFGEVR